MATVGLLIISHNRVGAAMVETAASMLGKKPLPTQLLPISRELKPEAAIERGHQLIKTLDQGKGVLVLTDMFGSTPSNIASALAVTDNVRVVAGVNLSMLVSVYNYPKLNLAKLADKAVESGQRGIMHVKP